jgi:hypothetical protein
MIKSLVIAAAIATITFTPTMAIAQPNVNQCNVTVRFVVNSAGKETIRISGQCGGRPPTATELAHLAALLVLPPWLTINPATRAQEHRWHVTGPCNVAHISKHPKLAVSCRNGQAVIRP